MKARFFHPTVVFLLTFVFSSLSVYAQDEDILIEPPLTWSINSIQIVWSVTQGATQTQETKFIYGADQVNSETFSKEKANERVSSTSISGAGGSKADVNAGKDLNPLNDFGITGAKVNASAYLDGGFNYNQTNRTTNTTQWSESEKNVVSQALTLAFQQNAQQSISNQRLLFTVDFINHTSTRLYFSSNSANTIPVYCGEVHIGDARLISENASIAATGKPIPCQFEMALNDTRKQSLVNNRPMIRFDGGQLLIQSEPNARERIGDAIQESTITTGYFTIAILSGNEVKEWKIRYFKKNPVTLSEALESINEQVRDLSNDDNKTIFVIRGSQLFSVCNAPLSNNNNFNWTTSAKVIKGSNSQSVSVLNLTETPRRGERYVFQLVSKNIKTLISKAKAGNSDAQFELALKYFNGEGIPQDKVRAVKILTIAAEQGNAEAQNKLGDCYSDGNGVPQDKTEAVKWYYKAANNGLPEAQNKLAHCYDFGKGIPENKSEAIKWYQKAAEQGYAKAQYNLGCSYAEGDGIPKDKAEATKWYHKAAEQGYVAAQYNLGLSYYNGFFTPENKEEAVKWYRKAAEQGMKEAQFNLGVCYSRGAGVLKDEFEAVKWIRKAAAQGCVEAQCALGMQYYKGNGVSQDNTEALKWFRKAAEQEYPDAQCLLGECYFYGIGVPEDIDEAIKWHRKAADHGSAWGQCKLGFCYAYGKGVPRNLEKAKEWLRKAAKQGNEDAIELLKKVESWWW